MRTITEHKISKLNRDSIEVTATDAPDTDGASHAYRIDVIEKAKTADQDDYTVDSVDLKFQKGGLAEAGVNGLTDQALLVVVLDRLRGFQSGPFSCRDNAIAITKLEECLMWMAKRYVDRAARGVEGQRVA
jgi:hypothetical protein